MKILAACLLSATVILRPELDAQPEPNAVPMPDLPVFYFDALSFASDQEGVSRLDVYVEVPYETIHFVKDDEEYRASYELAIELSNSSDSMISEKWSTEKVTTHDYDQSVSPVESHLSKMTFLLAPGEYGVGVQIKDVETGKTARQKRRVWVRNYFSDPFTLSDVMLVNHLDVSQEKKVVYPNISGNVETSAEKFTLFFEAYTSLGSDSSDVGLRIRTLRGDTVQSDSFQEQLRGAKTLCFHDVRIAKLVAGDYLLELTATPVGRLDSAGRPIVARSSRNFMIRWRGMPVSITDLDRAIDELQYVADKDLIDSMRKAPPELKRELFRGFWRKRDPSPNTERNELMEEYYARVSYANKHFTHYIDGWKTDMGMVYIIFGAPNNVERHPFDIDSKPYEVWTYYEQNREFVFVDATGFGDYRLQNPIWDLYRTRPR